MNPSKLLGWVLIIYPFVMMSMLVFAAFMNADKLYHELVSGIVGSSFIIYPVIGALILEKS